MSRLLIAHVLLVGQFCVSMLNPLSASFPFKLNLLCHKGFVSEYSTDRNLQPQIKQGHKASSTNVFSALFASNSDDEVIKEDILDDILGVAVLASQKACKIIKEHLDGAGIISTKSNNRDLLTQIDPLCEKVIKDTIVEHFPDHSFLGEESVVPGVKASDEALKKAIANAKEWLWVVDPIDGTTNFASGMPLNMPSIAVLNVRRNDEVMVSVLNDPHREEMYTAVRGRGAFLNGYRIQVGEESALQDAVVGMESPAGQESLEACLKGVAPLMRQVRTIRMLGSSAVFLPWVANGRLTAYWTPDERAWDIAAGALLVEEAGGRVTDAQGDDYTIRTRSLVASNGKVHDDIVAILRQSDAFAQIS